MAELETIPVKFTESGPAAEELADEPQGSAMMGEIVVTAQKRSEHINEVPIAISAISDYDLINALIGMQSRDGTWSITAWGRNLADEYYVTNVVAPTDSVARYTGMPETYGLSFTYNALP